jgi:hypothetical protein
MTNYCEELNIIPDSQHGFQSGKSTMTALISMVDDWEEALEREESVGVLLFDLSAAFDTLDPGILLEKLKSKTSAQGLSTGSVPTWQVENNKSKLGVNCQLRGQ